MAKKKSFDCIQMKDKGEGTMTQPQRTPAQIRQEGIQALLERLGAADTRRFFQQIKSARGDYTRDRDRFLPDWPIDEMVREADTFARPEEP